MPSSLKAIPLGAPFLKTLLRYLREEKGSDLRTLTLLLPTQRSRSEFLELLKKNDTSPACYPALHVVGDQEDISDEDFQALLKLSASSPLSLPPSLSFLQRQTLWIHRLEKTLKKIFQKSSHPFFPAEPSLPFWMDLTHSLFPLLDQMAHEGKSLSQLTSLPLRGDLAAHWATMGDILIHLARQEDPSPFSATPLESAQRHYQLLTTLRDQWLQSPPSTPIIMAGSRGRTRGCALLMTLLRNLPQGEIILEGNPLGQEDKMTVLPPNHPFYPISQCFPELKKEEVSCLPYASSETLSVQRIPLALEALLPPSQRTSPPQVPENLLQLWSPVSLLETSDPQEEARLIAVALKEIQETPSQTGALITPDLLLRKRVSLELKRWGLEVSPTPCPPLNQTPLGILVLLSLRLALSTATSVDWMAVLRHPAVSPPEEEWTEEKWEETLSRLEIHFFRKYQPHLPFWTLPSWGPLQGESQLLSFLSPWAQAVESLAQALSFLHLPSLLEAHKTLLQKITPSSLWETPEGEKILSLFEELSSLSFPLKSPLEYKSLLEGLLSTSRGKPFLSSSSRLHLLSPEEASLLSFDLVILGSLNEGVWPAPLPPDPWINPTLKKVLGLAPPEKDWGTSAFNFISHLGAPRVLLTRSHTMKGAPTLPSPWLTHLQAFFRKKSKSQLPHNPLLEDLFPLKQPAPWAQRWLQEAQELTQVTEFCPTLPPAPCPPLEARPRQISVTKVETWMRNPYGLYCDLILKLKPLDRLDRGLQPADRGLFLHQVLETFLSTPGLEILLQENPQEALDLLMDMGKKRADRLPDQTIVKTIWWPRFQQMARWFFHHYQTQAPEIEAVFCEVPGRLTWQTPQGPFTLTAQADRLDVLKSGHIHLVDYKTSHAPSQKEVSLGYAPQLPLEGWMIQEGAFECLSPGPVQGLSYWILKGGQAGGSILSGVPKEKEVTSLIQEAKEGLQKLVTLFEDPTTPYACYPRPERAPSFDPYAHLARVSEWGNS